MIDRIKQAIRNPKRVIYRYRDKIIHRVNEESLIDESIRYFPSNQTQRAIKIFFVSSKYDYGDKSRGLSFEENNFLHSLIHIGYEVIAFDPLFIRKKYGKRLMNRILLESVYRWQPDIVFFVLHKDEIEFNTLLELKDRMGIKTLNWFCDDHWRFENFSKYYAPYFNYVVTTYRKAIERYKKLGCENVVLSQWA
ncbi:MAG: hypothetical protein NC822_07015, partial [Candidatus Omnitrophica bacterium]|nr:hypothetical protein [Candidatus Omnitrophota bacterium]